MRKCIDEIVEAILFTFSETDQKVKAAGLESLYFVCMEIGEPILKNFN